MTKANETKRENGDGGKKVKETIIKGWNCIIKNRDHDDTAFVSMEQNTRQAIINSLRPSPYP